MSFNARAISIPLDLTEHENLSTFTSQWLQDMIFKVVREKKLATRSASHSKSSTELPGSDEGLSGLQSSNHPKQLQALEPVSLSTVGCAAECIDFLLT